MAPENLTQRLPSRQTVLVVEDSASVAAHLQKTLTRLGYTVPAVVAAGEGAIQQAIEAHPDLILIDIDLTGNLDGIEIADQICAQLDLPVIFLTDRADDPRLKHAGLSEPHHYLLKPIQDEELYATIEVILCRHRLETRHKQVEKELAKYRDHLEDLFQERNAELVETLAAVQGRNEELQREIAERKEMEKTLRDSEARHRKKAEQVLEESELMFKLMIDQIPYVIEFFWPDGLTFMVNRQWEETYRTDKAQVIGKFNLLQDPQIKELGILPLLERAFKGELVTMPDSEFDPAASDYPGRKRWLRTKVIPIKDDVGEVKFVAIMHEDITERKNAEDALRESQERFSLAQKVANVGSWDWNIQTGDLHWSEQIEPIFGFERGQFGATYEAFLECVHPQDRQYVIDSVNACIEMKKDYAVEHRIVWPDGTIKWVSETGDVLRNEKQEPVRMLGMVQDITERKHAEEQRKSHIHFLESLEKIDRAMRTTDTVEEMLTSVVNEVFSIFDSDRAFLVYPCDPKAPTYRAIVEVTKPEYPGSFTLDLDVPMDPNTAKMVELIAEADSPITFGPFGEYPLAQEDTELFSVLSQMIMAIYPKTDKPWAFGLHQCSYKRVWTDEEKVLFKETSRRLGDGLNSLLFLRNLRESEERYRQLVELVPDLIVVHHEGKVQFVNEAGVKLLGASSPTEIIGKPTTEFMSPAYHDVSKQRMQQLLAEGERLPLLEQQLFCLDGRKLDIEVVGIPFSHQGETAIQIIAHDITERKQAEKALHSYTERLEGLQQVGLELAAQLDLDSLLHSIVSRAVELGGGSAGGLYLHRSEQEVLELAVVVGDDPAFVGSILHPGEGLSGKVWKTDEPLAVADYQSWSGRSPLFEELPLQAVLGVPVRWGQQRLGVLFVWTGMPHVFSPSDTQLLSILATQAAVAIENARLFKAEREQRQLAETLREVSGVLNTSLDRGQVLDLILEQLAHIIEYDNASVMLLSDDTLEIAAQWGFQLTEPEMTPIQVARFAHLRDVLQKRRPEIIPDTATDPRWQHRQVSRNVHSWLGAPLAIQDRAIGVLNLGKKEQDFYTQRDAEIVMAIANQAAIAIENADLYDRTRRRSRELVLLNRVISVSATSRQIELILETACRELALTFDLPQAAAALFNEEKTELVVVAEYPSARPGSGRSHPTPDKALHLMQAPPAQYVLEHKKPLVVENACLEPHPQNLASFAAASGYDWMHEQGIVSLLALPMIVEEKVVGLLEVDATEPHRFTADEVSLTQRVAEQVAGALTRVHLEETQQRLSAAVEQAAEAVIITDPNGVILYVNPAFERITGHSKEQAIGLGPTTAPTQEVFSQFYLEMWQAVGASHVWQGRLTDRRPDGSVYTVDTIIGPVRTPSGDMANYVATMRDVTRELQLEEQFHQAQKMEAMGRLAGGIAHDFNNLLTVIHLSTRLLERQLHAQDPLWDLVQQIREAGQRATKLTGQLLSFSRREIVEPRLLNINNVTDEMSRMLQRLIREDVELKTALAEDLWLVNMDPMQVDQVLINLAVNASDAMPDGGTLTIGIANVVLDEVYAASHVDVQPGEYVQLTISDTGVGMSDQVHAHLFEPFFTTKELGKGTGLGLAIVYGIVKQNGGHIRVYSEIGQGTTFKIYLPRAEEGRAPVRAHHTITARGMRGTETILLVEDDAAVRDLAVQILQVHGYRILAAQDGMEALQVSQEHKEPIHLLLTDLVMPQINGRELAGRLRSQRSEMQVLFMSGYADEVIGHNSLAEEGVAFLPKPLTVESLTQKVREKAQKFPDLIDLTGIEKITKFAPFDDRYTAPLHGFKDAADYYRSCSSRQFLQSIQVPCLMVQALDDPFLSSTCYPLEEAEASPYLCLEIPEFGGHVGFWGDVRDRHYWSERRTAEFLNDLIP